MGRTSEGEVACTFQCLDLLVTPGHEHQMTLEPHEDEDSLSEIIITQNIYLRTALKISMDVYMYDVCELR